MAEFFKKQWNVLVGLATPVVTAIGAFLRAPPPGGGPTDESLIKFGTFFLTLAVGIIAIPVHKFRQKKWTWAWATTALALTLLTPTAFLSYSHLTANWTCAYAGGRVIIGSDSFLTEHGRIYRNEHPELTVDQLVWEHTGNAEEIWTKDAIESRKLFLDFLYLAILPLFAGSMICVTQAFYCGTRQR